MPESHSLLPNPSLPGLLVDLLREAPLGLTAGSLWEVISERQLFPTDGVSDRGMYQRVLRSLQQLESMGVISRSGKRYLLDVAKADEHLERQAMEILEHALQETTLTADPARFGAWLERAAGQLGAKAKK